MVVTQRNLHIISVYNVATVAQIYAHMGPSPVTVINTPVSAKDSCVFSFWY